MVFTTVTKSNFIITSSTDGHVKFWKKQDGGIEFVKDYRAHLGDIVSVDASPDGLRFATCSGSGVRFLRFLSVKSSILSNASRSVAVFRSLPVRS